MRPEPLRERALGRWVDILSSIGVAPKALRNRHGPCPICGGKDRFRFDDKQGRGTWFCSRCGAGDGIELVKRFLNVDFAAAARRIEDEIGAAEPSRRSGRRVDRDHEERRREHIVALWSRSEPISADDHAGRYLRERTGITVVPRCLRYLPRERYTEDGSPPSWHPVMLARVEPSDEAAALGARSVLHRTYLDRDQGKAHVAKPRKMLGTMPPGAAVRLAPHAADLGIAEGIETALSASAIFRVPCWAALTADLLAKWTPPARVTTVRVFADNDVSNTGQAAAYELARRLRSLGVKTVGEIPEYQGEDWNDVLLRRASPIPTL